MNTYLITLIFGSHREQRNVIAASSTAAIQIGVAMMQTTVEPCTLIAKPMRRLSGAVR